MYWVGLYRKIDIMTTVNFEFTGNGEMQNLQHDKNFFFKQLLPVPVTLFSLTL